MTESRPNQNQPARRVRCVWNAVHAPAPGVPRWARIAANIVPLTVLPSSVWRIAVCSLHVPVADISLAGGGGNLPPWLPLGVYVVLLSALSELLAFTAVGLVSTWGEIFPRWVPGLRGRRVPVPAVVAAGTLGATSLTLLWTWTAISLCLGMTIAGHPQPPHAVLNFSDWKGRLAVTAYAPLLLWGPLLGAVTLAYRKRRTEPAPRPRARIPPSFQRRELPSAASLTGDGLKSST